MEEALRDQGFEVAGVRGATTSRNGVDVFEVQHASRAAMTTFVLTVQHGIKPFEYAEVL
jgi:hypothetical protein